MEIQLCMWEVGGRRALPEGGGGKDGPWLNYKGAKKNIWYLRWNL